MDMSTDTAPGRATAATAGELSYAEAAALAVQREMEADARVVVLGEDVGRGGIFGQYKGLQQRFGAERVIDTPISEAAIMGAGVGMALAGLRPVVEMRVVDFALCGMDELVNQAAKNRFMFGGQGRVPLVARMPGGIWDASAAQHSQSLEAWFAHLPGVVVVCPSTPQDNHSLLRAAMQCGDPVVYIEHKNLWGRRGAVDESLAVPLGQAARLRAGDALTMVSWSRQLQACSAACDLLAAEGIAVELIDLRTLWPWDREAVFGSCGRTGRLMVVHEAVQAGGFGAEIAASAAEATGCRIARLGAPRIPVGYAPVLEAQSRVTAERIADTARALCR
ncbi:MULTISPECIES: transketolase C-terminal domain-containing protein [unclassified Variovorax]|uniref:alpha-ketoacid dehydrogenase subunit beta n=1 Tax=unclassified Variovorax TaxID=663243 RepID=UPI00076C5E8B|nr:MULTISPECIES: transketolase C-terminal domain-containing protein [unclassified Variovorax]KWT71305.1 Pyruvate dehydrogenase E1 component beta subunit [Variovorax sp. WDL1]PNG59339.1 2-oxoisovalerate dehydrogenase subunit beta [Variovorax sp. B4]PNG60870.1 2-oxoisovalerate dehydrogenase subunit beta [Variovorax sp. B2]VTV13205.1 2-oxoisovalerate dehydrogenase subunit beta [Variovorax sp. WDL1]